MLVYRHSNRYVAKKGMKDMKERSEGLIAARKMTGKSQREVARNLGISYQEYQRYEYGMNKKAIQTAIRIASEVGATTFKDFCKLWSDNPISTV